MFQTHIAYQTRRTIGKFGDFAHRGIDGRTNLRATFESRYAYEPKVIGLDFVADSRVAAQEFSLGFQPQEIIVKRDSSSEGAQVQPHDTTGNPFKTQSKKRSFVIIPSGASRDQPQESCALIRANHRLIRTFPGVETPGCIPTPLCG